MKKKVIWISAIVTLTLLIIISFRQHVRGMKDEKDWYIKQLDFEFSALLDSAERPGQVLFDVANGKLNREKEKQIASKLKYSGVLELLLYRPDGKLDLLITNPHDFRQGDSLYLNSNRNLVSIYRKGKLLSEHSLVKSLRGRPFRIPIIDG